MGMALLNVDRFLRLAEGGEIYSTTDVPPGAPGTELAFVRSVSNDAFRYRESIQAATAAAQNEVTYPDGDLSEQLAAIARLIKGRLGARIYLVSLGSFDTHMNQPERHATLLNELSDSIASFYADLAASGDADRTLALTFSEFGRRVTENGSGRDGSWRRSAALPLRPPGLGGLYGTAPISSPPTPTATSSTRRTSGSVYATLLTDWFGLAPATVEGILGRPVRDAAPFVASPVATGDGAVPLAFGLDAAYPNPFRDATPRATFRLSRPESTRGSPRVDDTAGRLVATLAEGSFPAGTPHRALRRPAASRAAATTACSTAPKAAVLGR